MDQIENQLNKLGYETVKANAHGGGFPETWASRVAAWQHIQERRLRLGITTQPTPSFAPAAQPAPAESDPFWDQFRNQNPGLNYGDDQRREEAGSGTDAAGAG